MLTVEDKLAIIELAARYSFAIDFHDGKGVADCFTDDGSFAWYRLVPAGDGATELMGSARSREELLAFGAGARAISGTPEARQVPAGPLSTGVHVTSNHVIDEVDGKVIHKCYLVLQSSIGVYESDVVKVNGSWKFNHRTIIVGYR
jgi:hypothetical protein